MSRKSKYSFKQKKWAVEQYLNGKMSAVEIAEQLDMPIKSGYAQISRWAHQYQSNQDIFLSNSKHNAHYSKEFKEKVVQEYLNCNGSLSSLANKYGIRSYETVRKWVSKYNSHIDNRDYDPHPEVHMTKARRKTTQAERIKIIQYCLDHDKNYSRTAVKFECSYQQVYSWTQKYLADGEAGLTDKRGRRKQPEELSKLDLANRRIKELERKLKEEQAKNEFLKKIRSTRKDVLAGQPKYRQTAIKKRWKIETYQLIHDCHQKYNWKIDLMCRWAKIARSAYYKHFDPQRQSSQRDERDKRIEAKIIEIAQSNNSLFGTEKMTMAVNRQMPDEKPIYHKTVYRLMCINDISSQKPRYQKPKFKHTTPEKTAENKLKRNFNASKPNEKWCTDITEVVAPNLPKAYLCTIFDLYDRYPVGYAISKHNDTALVQSAYEQAIKAYPNAHPLFHSDRGFQFTRAPFQNQLEKQGMIQSMSRVGCCIDNGPMEGWQGLIKEMRVVLHSQVASYDELNASICKTIDYYINEDPQKRFNGLTAGEMRREALKGNIKSCPIAPNHRIERYWQKIQEKKIKEAKKILS